MIEPYARFRVQEAKYAGPIIRESLFLSRVRHWMTHFPLLFLLRQHVVRGRYIPLTTL